MAVFPTSIEHLEAFINGVTQEATAALAITVGFSGEENIPGIIEQYAGARFDAIAEDVGAATQVAREQREACRVAFAQALSEVTSAVTKFKEVVDKGAEAVVEHEELQEVSVRVQKQSRRKMTFVLLLKS